MDKVYCPYCPATEERPDGVEMEMNDWMSGDGTEYPRIFGYCCPQCHSEAPTADTPDAARAAALQRYVEPLKPLELHEATGSEEPCVFMELKGNDAIRACDCVISSDLQCVEVSLIGSSRPSQMPINFYGKKWRCWSRRPTDEERKEGWK